MRDSRTSRVQGLGYCLEICSDYILLEPHSYLEKNVNMAMAYSTNIHLHETFALNDLLFPTLLLKPCVRQNLKSMSRPHNPLKWKDKLSRNFPVMRIFSVNLQWLIKLFWQQSVDFLPIGCRTIPFFKYELYIILNSTRVSIGLQCNQMEDGRIMMTSLLTFSLLYCIKTNGFHVAVSVPS